MEYFLTDNTYGFRSSKNNIQIEINNENTIIIVKINNNIKEINRNFIINNITPNFSVEMFYHILYEFVKYNKYKLENNNNQYIFEGYYTEPYVLCVIQKGILPF
jgi:hypothetical protein